MDNFDHEENTMSGIGGSHDTVLVLFQSESEHNDTRCLRTDDFAIDKQQKKLKDVLSCQKLVHFTKPKKRGCIDSEFVPSNISRTDSVTSTIKDIEFTWSLARFLSTFNFLDATFSDFSKIPSWSAFNSLITEIHIPKTLSACVPILPHPATSQASIFSTLINFQDAMSQVSQSCGALWSDEGVYHIAKELQLLFPTEFDNIFLGMGSFHSAKIVINCLGQYLKDSGITEALVVT